MPRPFFASDLKPSDIDFQRISKKGKFEILTKGIQKDTNKRIPLAVQSFILKTVHFQN